MKEFKKVFNYRFNNLHCARATSITLFHLLNYRRCLQTNIADTYGLSTPLIKKVIAILLELGLINSYPTKRVTNIGVRVNLIDYAITLTGKDKTMVLGELLQNIVNGLKQHKPVTL
ncbi:hypothetical protein WG904_03425 [Pedobacter sp. Du54]|uniref:hypothetical protein n=1 Tax=Pedobacter anseongensis TaxID=3133439 RepID=UPI0030A678CC